MRLALGVEYDGSGFWGWQIQPSGLTVQSVVEEGLSQIASESIRVFCAGRTDTGVHARCQVVHFDSTASRPNDAWVRGVNALIPKTVAVLWAREVDDSFHARYSALSRTYRYYVLNRAQRPGILDKKVGWYHKELDINLMEAAGAQLIGEHDFSAFRSSACQAKSPVRQVHSFSIQKYGDLIVFEITANAFLHHMVRNIIGTLIYVGAKSQPIEWLSEVIQSKNRHMAAPTFSPHGLYLHEVHYPTSWKLPESRESFGVVPFLSERDTEPDE